MSGSARAGTISREAYLRAVNPEALQCALSRARPGHLCFSVDKDLHGGRLFGDYSRQVLSAIAKSLVPYRQCSACRTSRMPMLPVRSSVDTAICSKPLARWMYGD